MCSEGVQLLPVKGFILDIVRAIVSWVGFKLTESLDDLYLLSGRGYLYEVDQI